MAADYARAALEAESARYRTGVADTHELLQYQQELISALAYQVQAEVDFEKIAAARLGVLLGHPHPLDGEVDVFAQGFIAPMKVKAPRIEQFHNILRRPDGVLVQDPSPEIRAEKTISLLCGYRPAISSHRHRPPAPSLPPGVIRLDRLPGSASSARPDCCPPRYLSIHRLIHLGAVWHRSARVHGPAEEIKPHHRRLSALPRHHDLGGPRVRVHQLPQVLLEQIFGHPEPAARVEHLLGKEEAVGAVQVADRAGRLRHQMERPRGAARDQRPAVQLATHSHGPDTIRKYLTAPGTPECVITWFR